MRFLPRGPSIPDELLIARDEGRVIFFCGAGVSRARAGLSDFYGLAEKVVEALGVAKDHAVRKLIQRSVALERETGIPGLISADRIFGLLEREFLTRDVEAKVAETLKPPSDADITAHRIMLDLARSPEGVIRLVTTNFDLLFNACDRHLQKHSYPRLPDPNRQGDFEGIIHLHGHVNDDYSGASGDGFVLSSSQFGDAYLAGGWATKFIREILEKYVVVFVGYAADDPPVHYLLEALNRRSTALQKMYAFQVGTQNEAEAKWGHKGVVPIAFDGAEDFKILWDTLAAWAERAVNPDAWIEKIIDMARKGPEELQPHERGQVAHLVSFAEGARKFATSNNPPPAEWLCVFDSNIRFLKPAHLGNLFERGPFFDPFQAFGLDTDQVPPKIDPENHYAKREPPPGSWNCFNLTHLDFQELQIHNYPALKGSSSINVPALTKRLQHLGDWMCKVSWQPATVWWASHQAGLHTSVQNRILHETERANFPCVRLAWRYIFTAWNMRRNDSFDNWYQLQASINIDGWSNYSVRQVARIYRPYLTAVWPYYGGPKPPPPRIDIHLRDIVHLDVQYPTLHERTNIPDDFLVLAVREFRKNLELAVNLEKELDSYDYLHLPPIEPDPEIEGESSDREFGIARLFFKFLRLFNRLLILDPSAAKKECSSWWDDDYKVFGLLRVWTIGKTEIFSDAEAGQILCGLNDQVFWNIRFQRDLLLVLYKRWHKFTPSIQKRIERRLIAGRPKYENEEEMDYHERRARLSLNRIHWLSGKGCLFNFDIEKETENLKQLTTEWHQQFATNAAASMEGRGGCVKTDSDYSELLRISLREVLGKAKELSGREFDRLVNKDPFAGLATERPVRALSALSEAARQNEYPEWAWRTFLHSHAREDDSPRFSSVIAQRLSRVPELSLTPIAYPVSEWLHKTSKCLITDFRDVFECIWHKIISMLRLEKGNSRTVLASKEPDWVTQALNSPAGKLAQVLMNDPQTSRLKARQGLPRAWLNHAEELLSLPGDHRRYALVIFAFNLCWFFYYDPIWAKKNLLSVLGSEGEDQEAFWDGFFWGAKHPQTKLFLRLKPWLLKMPLLKSPVGRREMNVLSAILLAGWGRTHKKTAERLITNDEMRVILLNADDDFRGQLLWHLESWAAGKESGSVWKANLPLFFSQVWPRQRQAKSPKMSAKLCSLAFSNELTFPAVVDTLLPLLTKLDEEGFIVPHLRGAKWEIVEKYPEKVLALLWVVLQDNATKWPYGVSEILPKIGEADPALLNDSRLVELKRRWGATG